MNRTFIVTDALTDPALIAHLKAIINSAPAFYSWNQDGVVSHEIQKILEPVSVHTYGCLSVSESAKPNHEDIMTLREQSDRQNVIMHVDGKTFAGFASFLEKNNFENFVRSTHTVCEHALCINTEKLSFNAVANTVNAAFAKVA